MYHGFDCLLTLALDTSKTALSPSELTENLQLPLQHPVDLQLIRYRPVPLVFVGLVRARMCPERYRIHDFVPPRTAWLKAMQPWRQRHIRAAYCRGNRPLAATSDRAHQPSADRHVEASISLQEKFITAVEAKKETTSYPSMPSASPQPITQLPEAINSLPNTADFTACLPSSTFH